MNEKMNKKIIEATVKHLGVLVGQQVTGIAMDDSPDTVGDFGQPVFGLKFKNGMVGWIMQDAEGNGPGHLSINKPEPRPTRKTW